jgi:hypothetical protein
MTAQSVIEKKNYAMLYRDSKWHGRTTPGRAHHSHVIGSTVAPPT